MAIILNSSGKRVISPSGKIMLGAAGDDPCACCCDNTYDTGTCGECDGVASGSCTDCAPSQFTITLTGITICTCDDYSSTTGKFFIDSGTPNGTHVLPQRASPNQNQWQLSDSGYSLVAKSCDFPSDPSHNGIFFNLAKSGTNFNLRVLASTTVGGVGLIFKGSMSSSTLCMISMRMTSDLINCNTSTPGFAGGPVCYGGCAIITPC